MNVLSHLQHIAVGKPVKGKSGNHATVSLTCHSFQPESWRIGSSTPTLEMSEVDVQTGICRFIGELAKYVLDLGNLGAPLFQILES